MLVSTFEILYKPLTPTGGAIARRVLQGYFLTISNLEANPYLYRLTFHISPPPAPAPERTLDGALFIVDVAGAGNIFSTLLPVPMTNRYYQDLTIPADSTALVLILSNIALADFFTSVTPNIEVRGYVEISLPCVLRQDGNVVRYRKQSQTPVRVLLNPESRATFLPNDWPASSSGRLDFDQTNSLLETASGQGLTEIPSDSCAALNAIAAAINPPVAGTAMPASGTGVSELLAMLATIADEPKGIETLNASLRSAGANVELTSTTQK